MSQIVLHKGLTWDTIPTATVKRMVDRDQLLERVAAMRAEWIEAAGQLDNVEVNLSMLFDDFEAIIKGDNHNA